MPKSPAPFTEDDLTIVRRAYARQMLEILGVVNNRLETALAALPRERFLGEPWRIASSFAGYRTLRAADPVVVYQDLVFALDPARGVNNGSPSLHAWLLHELSAKLGGRIVHIGASAGYYTAISPNWSGRPVVSSPSRLIRRSPVRRLGFVPIA